MKLHGATIERSRKTAHARGYDAQWRQEREFYLLHHPACVSCGKAATVVDHITPHRNDRSLFWDVTNWQAMCKSCHDRKTHTSDGGFEPARGLGEVV